MSTAAAVFLCCLFSSHILNKAASGVKVADQVKNIYSEMKAVKTNTDPNKRIRLVVLEIKGDYIDVEHIYREEDVEGKDVYQFFLSLLKPDQCRYLLYDCHFSTTASEINNELVSVLWHPETVSVKLTMQYSASVDSLRKTMPGNKLWLNISDLLDYINRDTFSKTLGLSATGIEGQPVHSTCGGNSCV